MERLLIKLFESLCTYLLQKFLLLLVFLPVTSFAQNAFNEILKMDPIIKEESDAKNIQVKKEDCKSMFLSNDGGKTGLCLTMVKDSNENIKPHQDSLFELDKKDLDNILERFHFMMSQDKKDIEGLQIAFRGFPIKYEDMVTSMFSYYLQSFMKLHDTEKVIDNYLATCTKLNQREKEFIKMFLIMDFKDIEVKTILVF